MADNTFSNQYDSHDQTIVCDKCWQVVL